MCLRAKTDEVRSLARLPFDLRPSSFVLRVCSLFLSDVLWHLATLNAQSRCPRIAGLGQIDARALFARQIVRLAPLFKGIHLKWVQMSELTGHAFIQRRELVLAYLLGVRRGQRKSARGEFGSRELVHLPPLRRARRTSPARR